MFKFLEARVGLKDFSRPVFLTQGVFAVDEGPPRVELQLQELGDVLLVGFGPLPQFLESFVVPGLGYTAVFHSGLLWFTLLRYNTIHKSCLYKVRYESPKKKTYKWSEMFT